MDSDLSHEALERFDDLDKRVSALEDAGGGTEFNVREQEPEEDEE